MIIDVHAHCGIRKFSELSAKLGGRPGREGPAYPLWPGVTRVPPQTDSPEQIEERLQVMDEAGVQMQVLSNPGGPYFDNPDDAVEGAHICNDTYARLIREHPKRFAAYGVLPLPHVKESVRELNRMVDDLGFVGAVTACSIQRTISPVEDRFAPIYEELNRLGCALYFHPSGNGLCSPLINDYGLTYSAAAPLEDTIAVAQMIAKSIPSRYPNIKIVVAHFGGATPILLNRLDHEGPPRMPPIPEPPSVTARRLYFDSVGHGSQIHLKAAVEAFGADHLMAGSDFAVLMCFEPYARCFEYIKEAGLPEKDVEQIFSGTAKALFNLDV